MQIFRIFIKVLTILLFLLLKTKAAIYEFIYEDTEVFDKCANLPISNGISDFVDLNNLTIGYTDGDLRIEGNPTIVWDVEPTDRVAFRAEIFKFVRGTWQPTVFTVIINDFCKELYKTDTMWYKLWTSHIMEEDRKCINNKNHTFHQESFNVDAKFNMVTAVEGRVKCVMQYEAFDQNDVKRPSSICFEVLGDIVKLKG